jgi:hypothetical protein
MHPRTLRTVLNGKRSRLISWIACLAMLLAALAPAVSHALSSVEHAGNAVEVCTMAGMQVVLLDADGGKIKPPLHKSMGMADCPYCASHANAIGLPTASAPILARLSPVVLAPSLFYHAARPLYAWAPAQSRAPPTC